MCTSLKCERLWIVRHCQEPESEDESHGSTTLSAHMNTTVTMPAGASSTPMLFCSTVRKVSNMQTLVTRFFLTSW